MQRIVVDKKSWAVGFWWQKQEKTLRKQVNEMSKQTLAPEQQPYNVYVTLDGLVGIGRSEDPRRDSRTPSLAAAFSRIYGNEGNVLAILRFDDGTAWLFALKDGWILSPGDQFGPKDELQSWISRFKQSKEWHNVIETNGTDESLETLRQHISQLRKRLPTVQSVSSNIVADILFPYLRAHPKRITGTVLVVALGIGGIYGVQKYMAYQDRQARLQRIEEKRQEMLEKKRESRRSLAELKRVYFPPHWEKAPEQYDALTGCYSRASKVSFFSQGWEIKSVACSPGQITVTRSRAEEGSFTVLPSGAEFQIQSPNTAIQSMQYSVSERDKARSLVGRKRVSANIYELARRLQSSVKLSWARPEPKKVKKKHLKYNPSLPKELQSPYWRGEWTLKDVPEKFLRDPEALRSIPGLVVRELKSNKKTWKLKGEVYASAK